MKHTFAIFVSCLVVLLAGCSGDGQSSSASPTQVDAAAKLEQTEKGIESSEMTPEQKAQALEYTRQGAEAAERQKQMAGQTGQ